LRVQKLFEDDGTAGKDTLWKGGEFIYMSDSNYKIMKKGDLVEYPTENMFPPYWRILKNVKDKETDIGKQFSVIILINFFSYANFDFDQTKSC
jgi:hypothetical protein